MGSPSPAADPVIVVGGGLAGLAAAARLAKAGHQVELFESTDRLGGSWAPYDFAGHLVDAAPSVIGFPAPWRDLFRKSGRPLETELARAGLALEPAPPAHYVFADASELTLPSERGEQYAAITSAYGSAAASRWRALVDELDQIWQIVRPLGLESELRGRSQLTSAVKRSLRPRRTIRQLADGLDEPHLAAVVASVAYRLGSTPSSTPAWCAVELSVQRTFGRWMITTDKAPQQIGRSSALVDALAARLALRKVVVHLNTPVTAVTRADNRVSGVSTADSRSLAASAVVCTVDPWQTYTDLLVGRSTFSHRRRMSRWQPALAPAITHRLTPEPRANVSETLVLAGNGRPQITYARPVDGQTLQTIHDYAGAAPSRSAGIAWNGFFSWLDRPPVTSELRGLFLAGPASPAGSSPSSVVLSGALASYACHDYLS